MLLKPIEINVNTAVLIVKAVCVLHNFVLEKEGPNSGLLYGSGDTEITSMYYISKPVPEQLFKNEGNLLELFQWSWKCFMAK